MYLGRGDYDAEVDFLEQYTAIADCSRQPEMAVQHMLGKLPLAEYLEEGMQRLEQQGIQVDEWLRW
jgi:hypothetical protein